MKITLNLNSNKEHEMKKVGLLGAGCIHELGTPAEMISFFECVKKYIIDDAEKILLQRLYQKYVRLADVDATQALFLALKTRLSEAEQSQYANYFEGIHARIETVKFFHIKRIERADGKPLSSDDIRYLSLRVAVTDIPFYDKDKTRKLAEYDAMQENEPPFWMRYGV
jgi:hypothetical protein